MTAPARIPPLIEQGHTPAEWVDILRARGIEVSERTLREKANRLGACYRIGRAMLITPEQLESIVKDGAACSKSTEGARLGGQGAGSNISAGPSADTTDAALAHLTRLAQSNGAGRRKSGGSVVTFSATKKPSPSRTL